jgi:hypothetical protein
MKIFVTVQRSEEPRRKEKTGYPYGLVGVLPRAELLQIFNPLQRNHRSLA